MFSLSFFQKSDQKLSYVTEKSFSLNRFRNFWVPKLIKFNNKFYVDLTLTFGCRSSAQIFCKVASVVRHVFQEEVIDSNIENYMDDFCGVGGQDVTKVSEDFHAILRVAKECGIPISERKNVPPTTKLEYVGFTIDTVGMSISIPEAKRLKYKNCLINWDGSKKELDSILGKLTHTTQVLKMAHPFLRRLYSKAGKHTKKTDHVHLNHLG